MRRPPELSTLLGLAHPYPNANQCLTYRGHTLRTNHNFLIWDNSVQIQILLNGSYRGGHDAIHIEGAAVERVSNFKFLCVYIKDDLTWSRQADSAVKTAQKRLYFLRRLKKFGLSAKTLTNFYRCTIESIVSGCITA